MPYYKFKYKATSSVDAPYNKLIFCPNGKCISSEYPAFADTADKAKKRSSIDYLFDSLVWDDLAYFVEEFKDEIIMQRDI